MDLSHKICPQFLKFMTLELNEESNVHYFMALKDEKTNMEEEKMTIFHPYTTVTL